MVIGIIDVPQSSFLEMRILEMDMDHISKLVENKLSKWSSDYCQYLIEYVDKFKLF